MSEWKFCSVIICHDLYRNCSFLFFWNVLSRHLLSMKYGQLIVAVFYVFGREYFPSPNVGLLKGELRGKEAFLLRICCTYSPENI